MKSVRDTEPADAGEPSKNRGSVRQNNGEAGRDEAPDATQIDFQTDFQTVGATESAPPSAPAEDRTAIWEPADIETEETERDPAKNLARLRHFHFFGRHEPAAESLTPEPPFLPALLFPYRDLSRVRHEYPVCLTGRDEDGGARPLTDIIDELESEIATDGDSGEVSRRRLHKLEAALKSLTEKDFGGTLSHLWTQAAKNLIASEKSDKKKEALRKNLDDAREALETDGEMIPCNAEAPNRLLNAVMSLQWRQRCEVWRDELATLIRRLQDVLSADFSRSPEATKPEHLRASSGTEISEEMDFEAMSSILSDSHLDHPLPEIRRERIRSALKTLRQVEPLFDGKSVYGDGDANLPFATEMITNDCGAALEQCRARVHTMVDFFKAVRIARLEIDNKYRETVHDQFMARFDETHLSDEEYALCPPVLLRVTGDFVARDGIGALLAMLGEGTPIKVLLLLDDLCAGDVKNEQPPTFLQWPARLASMAMALNHVYVMQAPVSNLALLKDGFLDGCRYRGPALFGVYTGSIVNQPKLPTYLNAATATESRAFPVFTFNPGNGETWAERMDVRKMSDSEKDWTSDTLEYRSAGGENVAEELTLTPADYLLCDARFEKHFWCVSPNQWHEAMLPMHEYLRLDPKAAESKIPYVLAVDDEGRLTRVVLTLLIVTSVFRCASFWRSLQELGGINNSFALSVIAEEKKRLAEEKQKDVEEIEKKYSLDLERDIGELTKEIVQRIAQQLITDGAGPLRPYIAPSATPTKAVSADAPAAEAPSPAAVVAKEEEEDEALSFDDPYIDTPLCTSCNECTTLNGQMFAYNENKQAYVKDASAGTFKELVISAEKCPVKIIHPGKPKNPNEPGLDELINRAAQFN